MKFSTERILTTHVGSLPRPQEVVDLLFAQDRGETYDAAHFEDAMRRAVGDAVRQQSEAGIDIVSDGEMSKISYATYIRHRLTGFEGDSHGPPLKTSMIFPNTAIGWSKPAIRPPIAGLCAKAHQGERSESAPARYCPYEGGFVAEPRLRKAS